MGRVMIERPAPVAGRDADIRTYPVKAGESVVAGDVVDVVGGVVTAGRVAVGSLAVGSIIKLNVGGKPTEFIVAHHGKPSSIYSNTFTGNTILLMKDCYESRQWHTSNVNDYANSAIHSYLNSTFLNLLDADVKSKVVQVKIPYRPGSGAGTTVSSGESGLPARIWLPSGYEIGLTRADDNTICIDGARLGFFIDGATTVARDKRKAYRDGTPRSWYLRSASCNPNYGASNALLTTLSGGLSGVAVTVAYEIRPALALADACMVKTPSTASPTQAIALQSGTGGQSIDVIFDGTAELPGITAGTSITSPGVQGYAPQDGWVWVRPEWEENYGTKVVTGSYVGTNKSGSANPNVLTFDFVPKLLIVMPESQAECGFVWSGGGFAKRLPYSSSYLGSLFVSLLGYTVSWYESTAGGTGPMQQCNYSGVTYHYAAIG